MSNHQAIKKFIFSAVIILLCLAGIAYGLNTIYQIHTHYSAAALTASEIGMLSQNIVRYANKVTSAKSRDSHQKNLVKLKSLIRRMEFKHWSLFKGNPGLSANQSFASEIKRIYFSAPHHAVLQIRPFLDHANRVAATPYQQLNTANEDLVYLKSSVKGSLIQSLSNTIWLFRQESERKVSGIILLLIGCLVVTGIGSAIGNTLLFHSESAPPVLPRQIEAGSVSTVLSEFLDHAYTEKRTVET